MRFTHALGAALALAAGATLTATAAAQSAAPVRPFFTDVFVAGDTGVPLTGLRAADFEVREDGAEVRVVECAAPRRARAQQLTLALVVDEAGVPPERRAAFAAVDRVLRDILAGGRSRVMVVSWGAAAVVVQPFTTDADVAARAMASGREASAGAATELTLETIVASLGSLPGKRAVAIFGGAGPSAAGRAAAFRSLAERANAAGVTVYWIDASGVTRSDPGGGPEPDAGAAARAAAAATGGLDVGGNRDPAEALFQVTRDLRGAWSIGFAPSSRPDGAPHRLEVKARREGVTVRARAAFADLDDERRIADRSAAALLLAWEDNPLGIQVSLTSEPKPAEGTQVVTVLVTVPLATLEFEPTQVSHDCDLTLWLAARDVDGQVIRAPKAKFPVSVPNDRVLTALTQTAGYTFRVPMKAGPAAFAVTVRDEISTQTSTAIATTGAPEAVSPEPASGANP